MNGDMVTYGKSSTNQVIQEPGGRTWPSDVHRIIVWPEGFYTNGIIALAVPVVGVERAYNSTVPDAVRVSLDYYYNELFIFAATL